jgi:hypothetical protein
MTRTRLLLSGLVVALTASVLVAAPVTVGVVGDHAVRHELAGFKGTLTDPD